jgi:hypothetical protein
VCFHPHARGADNATILIMIIKFHPHARVGATQNIGELFMC